MSTAKEQQMARARALAEKAKARTASAAKPPADSSTTRTADAPTTEDKQRHLAPVVSTPQVKPVRSTVDLSPTRHRALKSWCAETADFIGTSRVTTQDVMRSFVERLLTDETFARQMRDRLWAEHQ
jgi:hypothetical protein